MNTELNKIKEEHKTLAKKIRELKKLRKSFTDGYVTGLNQLRYEYRHRHIAYCELGGIERSKIENPREGNKPSEYRIEKYKEEYLDRLAQAEVKEAV